MKCFINGIPLQRLVTEENINAFGAENAQRPYIGHFKRKNEFGCVYYFSLTIIAVQPEGIFQVLLFISVFLLIQRRSFGAQQTAN